MLRNLRILFMVFLASQLLVQQCAGSFDGAICKNNKGTINIRDDEGSCKCSVHWPSNDGYIYVAGGGAYKFHGEGKTWNEARKICEADGSHLPIIDSDSERVILLAYMNAFVGDISDEVTSKRHFWLGIHDQFQEGDWNTVLDEPLGYAPWVKGGLLKNCMVLDKLDNTTRQNCGTLIRDCGYMDDIECDKRLPFFCEKPHTCL